MSNREPVRTTLLNAVGLVADRDTLALVYRIYENEPVVDDFSPDDRPKLKELEHKGIIEKVQDSDNAFYRLTEEGSSLKRILDQLDRWGEKLLEHREQATVLVGDDKHSHKLYARMLDLDVKRARTEDELFKILPETSLVILEKFFDGDTRRLLEKIKSRHPDKPVMVVTTQHPSENIIDWEIDDYLVKPFCKDELQNSLDRLLKTRYLNKDQRRFLSLLNKKSVLEGQLKKDKLQKVGKYNEILREIRKLERETDLPATVI